MDDPDEAHARRAEGLSMLMDSLGIPEDEDARFVIEVPLGAPINVNGYQGGVKLTEARLCPGLAAAWPTAERCGGGPAFPRRRFGLTKGLRDVPTPIPADAYESACVQ